MKRRKASGERGGISEERIINLFRDSGKASPSVVLGIGDDAALLRPSAGKGMLVATDLLAEGIHFTLPETDPAELGYKLVAVNVSDIAAMGGIPSWAFLSLALPMRTEPLFLRSFARGLRRAARKYGITVAGGDTTASKGGVFANLVLLGTVAGRRPLERAGAGPGDVIFVTGHLGASALGLMVLLEGKRDAFPGIVRKHVLPSPPHLFGAALGRRGLATAAIDLSDGLATDLRRLCAAGRTGAELIMQRIPVRPTTRRAAEALGQDAMEAALYGGEEYELLFTARPQKVEEVRRLARRVKVPLSAVGTIIKGRRIIVASGNGSRQSLKPGGWRHF